MDVVFGVTMNWNLNWQKKMRIIALILLAATACPPVFAQRLSITPPAVTVVEGDFEEFTVVLSSEPTGDVTVTIMRQDGTEVRLNRTELIFTSANWNVPQTVRLVAAEDEDFVDNSGALILIASGDGLAGGGITLSPELAIIDLPGETAQFTATVHDQDGETVSGIALEWSSADPSVATVDSDGEVAAVGFGKTTITAALAAASGTAEIWVDDPGNTLISERQILEILFKTTGGDGWDKRDGWLTDAPLNSWHGVTTDAEGYVTGLNLPYNNLTGIIPPSLGRLSRLEELLLYNNSLMGQIPPELGNLGQLKSLGFRSNGLTGSIPHELGNLQQLKELNLSFNPLTGPIPPKLGSLTQLTYLNLAGASLTGPIPPEFGNLTQLTYLNLTWNSLASPIPPELGKLTQLEQLWLFRSKLTGPIPPELGKLTELKELLLSSNSLTGPIPPELGNLTQLKELTLFRNGLTGPIPPEIGNLAVLDELALTDNQLSGSIPPELGNLIQLKVLALATNELTGLIPPELGNLTQLETFFLFENELMGSIPRELGNLTRLKDFSVGNNFLTGPIPPELGGLGTLKILDLSGNQLSGRIPSELGNLTELETLWLFKNKLTGPIPLELGDLVKLNALSSGNNDDLEGLLPRSLLKLSPTSIHIDGTRICIHQDAVFLKWWNTISDSKAEDCTPSQIERLSLIELYDRTNGTSWVNVEGWAVNDSLNNWHGVHIRGGRVTGLSLPNNALLGSIPREIANFTELEVLNLADNSLTGILPEEILSLSNLTELRVSGNMRLEGTLGDDMMNLAKLEVLRFEDTSLCASPTQAFQTWYTNLVDVSGAICDNPAEVRLDVPVAYLTQSIQTQEGSVRLIEGRDALLRVFVTGEPAPSFFDHQVVATVRGGGKTHRVAITRNGEQLSATVDESRLNNSFNTVIPGDFITSDATLVVEADPDGVIPRAAGSQDRFPSVGEEQLNVVSVPAMDVTVVPVLEANQPDRSIFEWTDNISDNSPEVGLLKYAFPFHEFHARSREPYFTSLDVVSDQGAWGLVLELEALRLMDNATGYYYGATASVNGHVRGIARLGGWTSMGKALDTEFAHEVGHNLNLDHAPCGGAPNTDPDFPHAGGNIGAWGFDFRDNTLVSPTYHRDIMGYCFNRGWISDYYFEKVIDYREQVEGKNMQPMTNAAHNSDVLVLWGGVQNGKLRIETPFPVIAAARLPQEDGPYRLEGLGQNAVLFSLSFIPEEDKFGNKYFFLAIPIEREWEESLEQIVLTGPEGSVTIDANDQRALSIFRDMHTGQVRAILRDWNGKLPVALEEAGNLNVTTTQGFKNSVRQRR